MALATLNTCQSSENGYDIIAKLAERLTSKELAEIASENAQYRETRKRRAAMLGMVRSGHSSSRSIPESIKRLQMATRAQDSVATQAAWVSCEQWMMAEVPTSLVLSAANDS